MKSMKIYSLHHFFTSFMIGIFLLVLTPFPSWAASNDQLQLTCPQTSVSQCGYFVVTPAQTDDIAIFKLYSHYSTAQNTTVAYGPFTGDIQVVHGDTDGDGEIEFITVPGQGGKPHIRVWKPTTDFSDRRSMLKNEFFAYDENFRAGLNVITADYDGDGTDSITVAPLSSGGPNIRTYKYNSTIGDYELEDWFFAFAEDFRGGVVIHAGDVDNDNRDELIIGPISEPAPLKVYDWNGTDFVLKDEFFPFVATFPEGYRIRVGDVSESTGSTKAEIVVTPSHSANPEIKVYGWNDDWFTLIEQFMAYGDMTTNSITSGINFQLGNVAGDERLEIVTTPWQENIVPLRVWQEGGNAPLYRKFRSIAQRYLPEFNDQGINIVLRDLQPDREGDGYVEIIAAPRGNSSPIVRLYRFFLSEPTNLEELTSWSTTVFSFQYQGEVRFGGAL